MSAIDLTKLPKPKLIDELNFEQIYQERKAKLLELYPEANSVLELESEPISYLLQENAYRELVWRQRVNEAAQAVMLAFARGDDLTVLAANLNTFRLEGESDQALLLRAQNSFETLSTAGPRAAYETLTRAVDARILDASAISPAGAECLITLLVEHEDPEEPDTSLITAVEAALNDETVRPFTDRLTVQFATKVEYELDVKIYLPLGPESTLIINAATQQLNEWINKKELGRSIYRSKLDSLLHVEGVQKVEILEPQQGLELNPTQYAVCTNINLIPVRIYD